MTKTVGSFLKQYLKFIKSSQGFEHIMQKVKIISFADGKCKAEFRVEPEHSYIFGFLHGGLSASLVDLVFSGGVSVNLSIPYLKNAQIGDEVTIEAQTIKAGKNLGFL